KLIRSFDCEKALNGRLKSEMHMVIRAADPQCDAAPTRDRAGERSDADGGAAYRAERNGDAARRPRSHHFAFAGPNAEPEPTRVPEGAPSSPRSLGPAHHRGTAT